MRRADLTLALVLALLAAPAAQAESLGVVKAYIRDELPAFDDNGALIKRFKRSELPKPPTPIVKFGIGHSLGIQNGDRVIYLRGLDVDADVTGVPCTPSDLAVRESGHAYAGTNMGMGLGKACNSAVPTK